MDNKVVYNLDFDELTEEGMEGVFSISLVEKPAIESNFITLSEELEDVSLSAIDDSKRILMGAVLIPEIEILRKDGSYIKFTKEVVRKSMESFFEREYQKNASIEHNMQESLSGSCIVESWIVEDKNHDKSNMYGMDLPVGTWVASMKVDEDTYSLAKEGKIRGYSIEGVFPTRNKVELSSQDNEVINKVSSMSDIELDLLTDVCNEAMNVANSKEEAIEFIKKIINS
jgi:hypothetical protein